MSSVKIPKMWEFWSDPEKTIAQDCRTAALEGVEISQCAWILAWWARHILIRGSSRDYYMLCVGCDALICGNECLRSFSLASWFIRGLCRD